MGVIDPTTNKKLFTTSGCTYSNLVNRINPDNLTQSKRPRYMGCTSDFIDFQDYTNWAVDQIGYGKDFHLDKDILKRGNKVYNRDTCVFVTLELNSVILQSNVQRGDFPIGVSRMKKKFAAHCKKGGKVKREYLGVHDTPELAFQAYKVYKESRIKSLAIKWKSLIDPRAYNALMNYEVLITD